MERISTNGAEFEVEEAGTGEPLLLIHGSIIGDAYKPLLSESALTSRYRVIQYHRRDTVGRRVRRGRSRFPSRPRMPWRSCAGFAARALTSPGTPTAASSGFNSRWTLRKRSTRWRCSSQRC